MSFELSPDGERLVPFEVEKPKRKPKAVRWLRGCINLVFLIVFLVLSFIGGFAVYVLRNPPHFNAPQVSSLPQCAASINMISVAADSALFQSVSGSTTTARTLLSLSGNSSASIDRPGNADSLNLAPDKIHVVESRHEQIAPYFFIYTWMMSDYAQFDEHLRTDGKYPSWSPDEKQIAFFKFSGFDRSALYVMDADGSNMRALRNTGLVVSPASWSPDGTQLVLSTSDIGKASQNVNLYIVNVKDGSERILSNAGLSPEYPAWSPDATSIAYVSHDIYTIHLDGSNRRNLTNSRFASVSNVGWSSDSLNLAFLARDLKNKEGIYVIDNDGAGLHTLYSPCPQ